MIPDWLYILLTCIGRLLAISGLIYWGITSLNEWLNDRKRMAVDTRPGDPTIRIKATTGMDGYRYQIKRDRT